MAGRRLMTLDARELLRRLQAGQKHRAIARDLGVARKTVAKYDELARQHGLLGGHLPEAGDLDCWLGSMVPEATLPRQPYKAQQHRAKIEKLRGSGVEMMAVFKRLCEEDEYQGSYSALRRYVVHLEQTTPTAFVRLETPPGEEAQVDFGSAGRMIDPRTGELRKAWVFVMTLSCSRHQYAELVFDQRVETWLRCHRHAFEAFGGVPRRIVLDNLKAAIATWVKKDWPREKKRQAPEGTSGLSGREWADDGPTGSSHLGTARPNTGLVPTNTQPPKGFGHRRLDAFAARTTGRTLLSAAAEPERHLRRTDRFSASATATTARANPPDLGPTDGAPLTGNERIPGRPACDHRGIPAPVCARTEPGGTRLELSQNQSSG